MNRFNPFMIWLLRSPLHFFISGSMMLISFVGRKSGKAYTIPVEYIRVGEKCLVFSRSQRIWWKNLQGDVPVTLHLRGQSVQAVASATTGDVSVFQPAIEAYLTRYPQRGKMFELQRLADGTFDPANLNRVAQIMVTIWFTPST